jgi:hypothetical protein
MSSQLTTRVALAHTPSGGVDHALHVGGPATTYCGVQHADDVPVLVTGTTTTFWHVTCGRCRRRLEALGLVAESDAEGGTP